MFHVCPPAWAVVDPGRIRCNDGNRCIIGRSHIACEAMVRWGDALSEGQYS